MNEVTADYCERRIQQEKQAAATASCAEAALAHDQLAREFAAKARELRSAAEKPNRASGRSTLTLRSPQ
ncbi:hypothetical protein PX554_25045 [Sphingomonas sp. H39-1-10]|uniref:hypothetical protein n=1 Tax=Sphingomonas pollutisoli TaxID=3030829 RepID=UPI0023B9EECD|nr:hypothetical protein [Sphingomonas pollutisoli]MDF0491388.1 hypothetical protein [Sphingomonas pollutisoli]